MTHLQKTRSELRFRAKRGIEVTWCSQVSSRCVFLRRGARRFPYDQRSRLRGPASTRKEQSLRLGPLLISVALRAYFEKQEEEDKPSVWMLVSVPKTKEKLTG